MARVPFVSRDDVPDIYGGLFDHSSSTRGHVSNMFRALMGSPKLFQDRYDYSNSLRKNTDISDIHRELAILTVGRIANSEYEFLHHARAALDIGVRPTQIDALAAFETSAEFDEREQAVMRYAAEVTTNIHVSDATWDALARHFTAKQLVELALIVGWYNQTVRVIIPLQIELEPDSRARYEEARRRSELAQGS